MHDVRLVPKGGGAAQKVVFDSKPPYQSADVAQIDFTDNKGRCTDNGQPNITITGRVAPGEYERVTFVNGVPEALNHAAVESAKPPLDDVTMYWGWLGGYRFAVAELAPVNGSFAQAGFVHIGSSSCTMTGTVYACALKMRNEVTLNDFDPDTNTIVADLSEVFKSSDLSNAPPLCHSTGPRCKAPYAALGVDMDTGAPSPSQTVFRVE